MSKQEAFEAALSESVGDYLRKIAPYAGRFRPDFMRGANRIDDLERQLAEIKRQAGDAKEFVLAQINADLRGELAAANARLLNYTRLSESGESLGGELEERERRLEVERQLAEEREAREKDEIQIITERDMAEDAVGELYEAVTGFAPEWSNQFNYTDAVEQVETEATSLRARVQELDADVQKYREWIACRVNIKECSLRKGMWTWPFHAIRYNTRDEAIDAAIASLARAPAPGAQ